MQSQKNHRRERRPGLNNIFAKSTFTQYCKHGDVDEVCPVFTLILCLLYMSCNKIQIGSIAQIS